MLEIRRFRETDLDDVYETINVGLATAVIAKVYE